VRLLVSWAMRELVCCASSVLRKRDVERGRRVDVVFYGVLREEWQGD
jgi:hypothetical protein